MARKLRVEYPGAIYHVMNRGDQREEILRYDEDRQRFIAMLGGTSAKSGWQAHVLCLVPNHFHLVVETPSAAMPFVLQPPRLLSACQHNVLSVRRQEAPSAISRIVEWRHLA